MSTLQPRAIALRLGQGVDTKQSEEDRDPSVPVVLENAVFTRGGKLIKRNGYELLAQVEGEAAFIESVGVAAQTQNLAVLDDELVRPSLGGIFSYSESVNGWTPRASSVYSPQARVAGIFSSPSEQLWPDCDSNGSATVYAYESAGSVFITVVDELTGAVLAANKGLATGLRPRVMAVGTSTFRVFYRTATAVISKLIHVEAGRVVIPAAVTLTTTLAAAAPYFTVAKQSNNLVIAFNQAAHVCVGYVTPDGHLADAATFFTPYLSAAPAFSGLTLGVLGGRYIYLAHTAADASHLNFIALDSNLVEVHVEVDTIVGVVLNMTWGPDQSLATDALRFWYEVRSSATALPNTSVVYSRRMHALTNGSAAAIVRRSVGLATKAFVRGSAAMVGVVYESALQPTFFVVDVDGTVAARTLTGSGGGTFTGGQLPSVVEPSPDRFIAAVPYRTRLVAKPGGQSNSPRAVARVELDFSKSRFRSAKAGGLLHFAGAAPSLYDGQSVVEAGFHVFPELSGVYGSQMGFQLDKPDAASFTLTLPKDQPGISSVGLLPIPCGAQIRPGSYICLFSKTPLQIYVWFTVDDLGTDPGLNGFSGSLRCDLLAADTQREVANKICRTCQLQFTASPLADWYANVPLPDSGVDPATFDWKVVIYDDSVASVASPGVPRTFFADETTLCVSTTVYGDSSHASQTCVLTPAGQWLEGGRFIVLESSRRTITVDHNLRVAFYFVVDGVGSMLPTDIAVVYATVPVAISSTASANAVGIALATAIDGYRATGTPTQLWSATSSSGPVVRVTNIGNGSIGNDPGRLPYASPGPISSASPGATTGQRQYVATYEWTDARGTLHRSAASRPVLVTNQAAVGQAESSTQTFADYNQTNSHGVALVTSTTLRLTRRTGVNVVLWRTTEGRTTYYRLATVANDPTVDTVTFRDTVKDTDISRLEQLYTGSELPNNPPPASQVLTTWQDRLWWGALDAPQSLWYSKIIGPPANALAPAWSEALQVEVDTQGGAVTALAVMDDRLIIFKESRILVLDGTGANNNGDLAQLGAARAITTDVGCLTADSVVLTGKGLLFQSAKGIYLLDTGMGLSYIGAPVEQLVKGPATSATLMPDTTQVRFTFADGDALIYDYFYGSWGSFTPLKALGAVVVRGKYHYLRADGSVARETPGAWKDLGQPIRLKVVTAWIHPADLVQGYGRVWRVFFLAKYRGAHRLEARFAFDGEDHDHESRVFDATAAFGANKYGSSSPFGAGVYGGSGIAGGYEVCAHLSRQKCRAIRVTVQDIPPTDGEEAIELLGLALEVGAIAQTTKLPTTRTMKRS